MLATQGNSRQAVMAKSDEFRPRVAPEATQTSSRTIHSGGPQQQDNALSDTDTATTADSTEAMRAARRAMRRNSTGTAYATPPDEEQQARHGRTVAASAPVLSRLMESQTGLFHNVTKQAMLPLNLWCALAIIAVQHSCQRKGLRSVPRFGLCLPASNCTSLLHAVNCNRSCRAHLATAKSKAGFLSKARAQVQAHWPGR